MDTIWDAEFGAPVARLRTTTGLVLGEVHMYGQGSVFVCTYHDRGVIDVVDNEMAARRAVEQVRRDELQQQKAMEAST